MSPTSAQRAARVRAAAAAAGLALVASRAAAGESEADAIFHEAQTLFDGGHVFEACVKFERSMQLDPQLGRLLNVAFCHEAEGRAASAKEEYEAAAAMAASRDQKEREAFARARAAALAPKVARLRVEIDGAPTEVWVDARRVESWSAPVPVDPGAHTVTVVGPRGAHVATAQVAPAGETSVRVALDAPPGRASRWRRDLGVGLLGAGALGVAVGVSLGITAAVLRGEAGPHCVDAGCLDVIGATKTAQAKVAETWCAIGVAGGVSLAAAGVALLLTAPRASATTARVRVVPAIGAAFAGAAIGGSW